MSSPSFSCMNIPPPPPLRRASPIDKMTLVDATKLFVQSQMKHQDGSHDFSHIERVHRLALFLAKEEKIENTETIELAALLHDIKDWKYITAAEKEHGPDSIIRNFLELQQYPEDCIQKVINVVHHVSFRHELGHSASSNDTIPIEASIVQDADRLDALGAIGIARCFTFGGTKHRPLYDPSQPPTPYDSLTEAKYKQLLHKQNEPILNHFYEKLLWVKDKIKTKTGKTIAEKRHQRIIQFLNDFHDEWNLVHDTDKTKNISNDTQEISTKKRVSAEKVTNVMESKNQ